MESDLNSHPLAANMTVTTKILQLLYDVLSFFHTNIFGWIVNALLKSYAALHLEHSMIFTLKEITPQNNTFSMRLLFLYLAETD